jgi:hypothetical protein
MATAAQVFANQANAKHSTGPVTPEGKARDSQNATAPGLFSASAFIRSDEQDTYEEFRATWTARLAPDGPLEETLVGELVQAAWRLRRCTLIETAAYELKRPLTMRQPQRKTSIVCRPASTAPAPPPNGPCSAT